MINVWDYKDAKRLKILDDEGNYWIGNLGDVNDVGDEDPEYGLKEDSLTLWIQGRPITIAQSEIKSVEILE